MALFSPAPGGGKEVDYGYKGKGVLLHLLVDTKGNPIALKTTSASGNERQQVKKLLKTLRVSWNRLSNCSRAMPVLEADKGYDSAELRQTLIDMGILPLIPWRKVGKSNQRPSSKDSCKLFNVKIQRWKVERSFAWLKRKCRRLLMRWERLFETWSAFVQISLIYYWTQKLLG